VSGALITSIRSPDRDTGEPTGLLLVDLCHWTPIEQHTIDVHFFGGSQVECDTWDVQYLAGDTSKHLAMAGKRN
jgi:hypothetical protein